MYRLAISISVYMCIKGKKEERKEGDNPCELPNTHADFYVYVRDKVSVHMWKEERR